MATLHRYDIGKALVLHIMMMMILMMTIMMLVVMMMVMMLLRYDIKFEDKPLVSLHNVTFANPVSLDVYNRWLPHSMIGTFDCFSE